VSSALHIERLDAGTALVVVSGDTLGLSADALGQRLAELADDGIAHVVVDFSELSVLNSKLLDVLVRASRDQRAGDGAIAVVAGHGYIGHMLEISETGGLVLLADSRAEALEVLRSL
jgi:anti-anti-sigma regulatory factor